MSSQAWVSVGAVRRATAADAEGIGRLFPSLPPVASTSDTRAIFVIDGETALLGAVQLEQASDHLAVGPLATVSGGERHETARVLIAFAEMTARAISLREVRIQHPEIPWIVNDGTPQDLATQARQIIKEFNCRQIKGSVLY